MSAWDAVDPSRADSNRPCDGDWMYNRPGRPDARARAALEEKSGISDRQLRAIKRQGDR